MSGAWRWSLVAVAALGVVASWLPLLLYWAELPEPIAVHWSADLTPDGAMAKRFALLPSTALIVGALLLSLIRAQSAYVHGRTSRLALVAFVAALAAVTSATIIARNVGRAVWSDAGTLAPGTLALPVGAALLAGLLAYWIGSYVWRDVRPPAPTKGAPLPLAAGARAFWSAGASNRWLLGVGVCLLIQGVVLQAWLQPLMTAPLWLGLNVVVFVALELFSRIVVTVDSRGVAIRYGHLGLWTRRVPLATITGAQGITLDALEHGGWGYRGGLRLFGKASIVVRSGPAIRLDLQGGRTLFVTVDDADTGARLLNALLERTPPAAVAQTARS